MSSSGLAAIDPVGAFNRNDASALQNAATRQQNDTNKSLLPDYIAAQRADYQKSSALAPLDVQNATEDADAKKTQYGNDLIANAAQAAKAADPADAPQVWDDAMKAALAKGVTAAGQYVGHYRPQLADNVADIYGGKNAQQGATAAALNPMNDPVAIDRAISQMTPDQRTKGLKLQNTIIEGFNRVRDETSFNNEVDDLRKAGLPVDNFLLPGADWRLNYAHVAGIIKEMTPRRDALQNYIAQEATGMPPTTAPALTKLGANESLVDPITGKIVTTAPGASGKFQYLGVDKTGGDEGAVFDPSTGRMMPASGAEGGADLQTFASRMMPAENATGNPGAKNPRSSATGNGQFIDSTWLSTVKSVNPPWAKGLSDQQILAKRADPGLSNEMTVEYAQQNAGTLASQGFPVTTASLALAHRFGPQGAEQVLRASPDTPMASILPKQVIAANPELAKMNAGQYVQKIVGQVGNDPVNANGGAGAIGNPNLHGADYLKSLPDQAMAAQVKAIVEGRMQQPTSFFMKTPQGRRLMRAAAQYDPNFDLSLYQSRVQTQNDLAKGKMGQNVASFNTAIGHADRLDKSIDALGNSSYFPMFNQPLQAIKGQTDPEFQSALKVFQTDKAALVDELTRAFRGSGGNVHDIESWERNMDQSGSPEALHSAVREGMHLLESRIEAVGDQYSRGMRTTVKPETLLTPSARAGLARLTGQNQTPGMSAPARIKGDADYQKLASGTIFVGPDGLQRRKP